VAALGFFLGLAGQGRADNLIVNGNFESGNTGFTSGYAYSPGNLLPPSTYDIIRNPVNDNQFYSSYGDHTTGSGLMMVVNGSLNPGTIVWSETVAVVPQSTYTFTFFGSSAYPLSPALLDVLFNGVEAAGAPFTMPANAATWQQYTTTWNSGINSSLTLEFVDRNLNFSGNDFALDDIFLEGPSLGPVPEPSTLTLLGIGIAGMAGYVWRRKRAA
jgi:hypothetical protein